MNDYIVKTLQNLGLSEKEVLIYLALLQLGTATPYQIAKKAGLKRPTAYVLAEELVEKGLIVHIPGEEKKKYIARNPEVFVENWERRVHQAKRILPELQSFQKNSAKKASIMYFEGMEGLRQAYQYREKELHDKEIVGFFASNEDASPEVHEYFMEWNEYKEKHGTRVRGLTVDSPDLMPYGKFINEGMKSISVKFLPKNLYDSKVSIESCDGKFVRIFLFESVETLIIESPKFATAVKEIFELTWKALPYEQNKPTTWDNSPKAEL